MKSSQTETLICLRKERTVSVMSRVVWLLLLGHGLAFPAESLLTQATDTLPAHEVGDEFTKDLGDEDRDLLLVPVRPCRIADTQRRGGIIAAGTVRHFDVALTGSYTHQGGSSDDCNGVGSVGAFGAALIIVTAVTPQDTGHLAVYPLGNTPPVADAVPFSAGVSTSVTLHVKLDQSSALEEMSIAASANTHVTLDIVGYFRRTRPSPMALSCLTTADASVAVSAGGTANLNAPACTAPRVGVSTNCESSTWQMPFVYISAGTCSAQNNSSGSATLKASRVCCLPEGFSEPDVAPLEFFYFANGFEN